MGGQLCSALHCLLAITLLTLTVGQDTYLGPLEFCQNEALKATCGRDEVIVMTSAMYGRMKLSRCVDRDYGYIGCEESVLRQADSMCSGRRECEIAVPNSHFDESNPCPKDLKSYLETKYQCVKVETERAQPCRTSSKIKLTASSGTIGSTVSDAGGRGMAECPWLISAPSGQRINITLWDFGVLPHKTSMCQAYASIREKDPSRTITVCADTERVRHIYTSVSNNLEVRVMPGIGLEKNKYFLLKYEVVGCPDPDMSTNGWFRRRGNTAEVGCDSSGHSWTITCTGNVWSGQTNNCSDPATGSVSGRMAWESQIPFGASMFVICAIALALGILILVAGLVILKCRRRRTPAVVLETHVYQSAKQPPALQHRQLPPVSPDNDSLYQSSENEYSYIADVNPVPVSSNKAVGYVGHGDFYQVRKCQDYGTTRHKAIPAPPPPPHSGDYPIEGVRYVERVDSFGPEPPAYFVLDHDQSPSRQTSVDAAPMPLRPTHNNNTTSSGFGNRAQSSSKCNMECESLPRNGNQSIQEFATYDHMDPNCNHKSV